MLGFLIPQSLDFICHNIGIIQMFHFRLHISRDPRPPSIHHMKNPLPNITDTAQATSGPFPEFLGSDTPPSTATSLATRILPGFAKVKPSLPFATTSTLRPG